MRCGLVLHLNDGAGLAGKFRQPVFPLLSIGATKVCRGNRGAQSGIQKSNSSKMPKDGFWAVNSNGERWSARPCEAGRCQSKRAAG